MLTRVPDYYEAFHCLAGACPHTCCEKWEVVVDEETARRYQETPGSLGERLREALQTDEEGDFCFPLRGGRCPFLNRENLCEIHRILGAEATSLTCRTHPRFIEEYGPFREVSLCASCPAACDLLLGSTAPLSFLERETAEPEEPGDPWLCGLLPLRERMLRELADRPRPLQERKSCWMRTGQRTLRLWQRTGRSGRRRYRPGLACFHTPCGCCPSWRPWTGTGGSSCTGRRRRRPPPCRRRCWSGWAHTLHSGIS